MKVNELLAKLKGKYTTYTLIKDDYNAYIPWTKLGKRDWQTLKVKKYKIVENKSINFDKKLNYKNTTIEKDLVIVWED